MERSRPKTGAKNMKMFQDNARPHVSKEVKSFLSEPGISIIRNPPYSADLAFSDFWLLDFIESRLGSHTSVESKKKGYNEDSQNIPANEYKKTFDKWVERMQLCINVKRAVTLKI